MKRVALGSQGLEVSRIGLGCMGMSTAYGPADDVESIATIHRALDLGVSFLDTADMYGWGHNEELLANVVRPRRDEVQIATKFGNVIDDEGNRGIDGSPEHVRRACDASLKRLGVEVIHLFYQHRVDSDVAIEETVGAMSELVQAGKVHHLGLSEASSETIERAHAVHPISALQSEYSLWTRDIESDVLPTCRSLGIGFVPYSPLGRGFLTGAITSTEDLAEDDWRRHHPRFQQGNIERNRELVARIEELAATKRVSTSELALAWVMAQGDDVVPIPGTRRIKNLESNVRAVDVHLGDEDLAALDEAAPPGAAAGNRYPDMSAVNR
ncbi:MAG: aldo/keto reductase [Actinobacteria bacterium]|nr:aldo/keto reductase [Actinomycetota bacterium]